MRFFVQYAPRMLVVFSGLTAVCAQRMCVSDNNVTGGFDTSL